MSYYSDLLKRRPVTIWHARLVPGWRLGCVLIGLAIGTGIGRGWSALSWVELATALALFVTSLWCRGRLAARGRQLLHYIDASMVDGVCHLDKVHALEYEAIVGEPLPHGHCSHEVA